MDEKYRKKIESFCRRNGYPLRWQKLKFGYERAVLSFTDSTVYTKAQTEASKIPETKVSWNCHFQGQFDAEIYLMYAPDHKALKNRLEEEKAVNEAWWKAYHEADEETRKKMASGKH